MPKTKITANFLNTIKVAKGSKMERFFCTTTRGLVVEVRDTGLKTFYAIVFLIDGRRKQVKIGRYPEITLHHAIRQTQELRGLASNGVDPTLEKEKLKSLPTVSEFSVRYLDYGKTYKKNWHDDFALFKNWINPAIGDKKLNKVEISDVSRLHNRMFNERSSATANRAIGLLKHMYNIAILWGEIEKNPCKGVKYFKEVKRERFLDNEELKRLMEALSQHKDRTKTSLIFLLLVTGARKSEALKAKWVDFDINNRIWKIPHTNSKSGKTRYIPLPLVAIKILQEIVPVEDCPYVFAGKNNNSHTHVSNIFPFWKQILEMAKLESLRIHDLRHSFASILVSKGRSLYEVQQILGHSRPEMTQRYSHFAPDRLIEATSVVDEVFG